MPEAPVKKAASPGRLKLFVYLLVGILLVGAAIALGTRWEVGPKFKLDLQGQRAWGTASRLAPGEYRLRYSHTSGAIYARLYRDDAGIPDSPREEVRVLVAYNPAKPDEFQPAGISYLPTAILVVLTAVGATMAFFANHRLMRSSLRRVEKQQEGAQK